MFISMSGPKIIRLTKYDRHEFSDHTLIDVLVGNIAYFSTTTEWFNQSTGVFSSDTVSKTVTIITFTGGESVKVKETPEEIRKLIEHYEGDDDE